MQCTMHWSHIRAAQQSKTAACLNLSSHKAHFPRRASALTAAALDRVSVSSAAWSCFCPGLGAAACCSPAACSALILRRDKSRSSWASSCSSARLMPSIALWQSSTENVCRVSACASAFISREFAHSTTVLCKSSCSMASAFAAASMMKASRQPCSAATIMGVRPPASRTLTSISCEMKCASHCKSGSITAAHMGCNGVT
mmetsp:Transcript_71980/g.204246  ORF Transcript_71980/g.204246 Transcript_71980/m.204246 type:complete len:200 (+) Transcript_71980:485-1084(+)